MYLEFINLSILNFFLLKLLEQFHNIIVSCKSKYFIHKKPFDYKTKLIEILFEKSREK